MALNRILIIGSPGSGKTYLSKLLSTYMNLPIYSIDKIYWRKEWIKNDDDGIFSELFKILNHYSWIIEGTYIDYLFEERVKAADLIIYIDLNIIFIIINLLKRKFKYMLNSEQKTLLSNDVNMQFMINTIFYKKARSKTINNLISNYDFKTIIINKKREINILLKCLQVYELYEYKENLSKY